MFNVQEFVRTKLPFLSVAETLKIVAKTKVIKLAEGEVYIKEGEVNENPGYIAKGLMRAYTLKNEAEEYTVVFRKEGEFIGALPSMLREQPANETVVAMEDSVLFQFDWKGFKKLAHKNATISRAYSHIIEEMLLDAVQRIQDFTLLSPEERYLKLIEDEPDLVDRVPLKHIATYLGIAVPSISRMRARIAKKGN